MVRTYFKTIISCITVIFLFASCEKKDDNLKPVITGEEKVFIVCEGLYSSGNAALSLYLPEKDSVYEDVYKSINNKSLGDIFQSMTKIGDRYYLCINNSDRIIALNNDLTLHSITSCAKPRYVLRLNDNKAYVSSLYHDKVFLFNPSSVSVTSSITLSGQNTEGMLLHDNRAFICTWDTAVNKIYVVNIETDALSDSFTIAGFAPQQILLDKEQKLWVLSGNTTKGRSSALTRLDPSSGQIIKSYVFNTNSDVVKPAFNKTRDTLYFIEVDYGGGILNNGIYRMSIYDEGLPKQPFITAQSLQYFWGLGIDPKTGDIYVGDPKGFNKKGSVMIYRPDGSLKKQFNTGVGPGYFYFDN